MLAFIWRITYNHSGYYVRCAPAKYARAQFNEFTLVVQVDIKQNNISSTYFRANKTRFSLNHNVACAACFTGITLCWYDCSQSVF